MIVVNETRNTQLITHGRLANTFFSRLKGLLGEAKLSPGEGLVLENEKSIHTLFMRFPIDVVYLNQAQQIIQLTPNMPPYRLGPFINQAQYIVELPVDTIEQTRCQIGDQIRFIDNQV